MTEQEWLTCDDPKPMLEYLRGRASDRKLRLFAAACCRRVAYMLTEEARAGIDIAERVAEGLADSHERRSGRDKALHAGWLKNDAYRHRRGPAKAAVCDALSRRALDAATNTALRTRRNFEPGGLGCLMREIIPDPFRAVSFPLAWWTASVLSVAMGAYEERALPSGELDPVRLAVLSDALEEAGCDDATILDHLRGPGPHVRGCWALDLILGK